MAEPVATTASAVVVEQQFVNPFELWIDKMQGFWNIDVLNVFSGADDDDENGDIPPGFPCLFVYSGLVSGCCCLYFHTFLVF